MLFRSLLAAAALALSSGAGAAAVTATPDCPMARQPYSARTVLLDLLLDPATKAVLQADPSGLLAKAPKDIMSTQTPTFAAILAPEHLAKWVGVDEAAVARLDAALAAVPVSDKAAQLRCARYDLTPPKLPPPSGRAELLVFDKSTGFKDAPSVEAAGKALEAMAARRGWTLVTASNAAVFNPAQLNRFKAVIWNNVSGDVLTVTQRAAFKAYVEGGGGFVGIHGSGGDFTYDWSWYQDALIGARFIGHPRDPQFQEARVVVENGPLTQGLPAEWRLREEWYSFAASPRLTGARVLARLDEASYAPGEMKMGDHPVAWTRDVGKGRSFYTAIGHLSEAYSDPNAAKLMEAGVAWAAGDQP